jgi:hypothetical protein
MHIYPHGISGRLCFAVACCQYYTFGISGRLCFAVACCQHYTHRAIALLAAGGSGTGVAIRYPVQSPNPSAGRSKQRCEAA